MLTNTEQFLFDMFAPTGALEQRIQKNKREKLKKELSEIRSKSNPKETARKYERVYGNKVSVSKYYKDGLLIADVYRTWGEITFIRRHDQDD